MDGELRAQVAIEENTACRPAVQQAGPPHMAPLPETHVAHGVLKQLPVNIVIGAREVQEERIQGWLPRPHVL